MHKIRVKPWNRVDGPVYSLSTTHAGRGNLNICSYVTPISLKPKRFIIGVYKHTKTLENLEANPVGLLNYLSADHADLIALLGKKTGHKVDKVKALGDRLEHASDGLYKIVGSLAVLHLMFLQRIDCGDHWAWLADVDKYENIAAGKFLTLDELKRKKIILA